jgi:hypothetical protein
MNRAMNSSCRSRQFRLNRKRFSRRSIIVMRLRKNKS